MSKDSRQMVLEAATKVFAERGFYGARVADITQASFVNVRIIYHFFESKEHLYDEVLKNALAALKERPVPQSGYAAQLVAWEAASNWQVSSRIFDEEELRLFCSGGSEGSAFERALAWAKLSPHCPPPVSIDESEDQERVVAR